MYECHVIPFIFIRLLWEDTSLLKDLCVSFYVHMTYAKSFKYTKSITQNKNIITKKMPYLTSCNNSSNKLEIRFIIKLTDVLNLIHSSSTGELQDT